MSLKADLRSISPASSADGRAAQRPRNSQEDPLKKSKPYRRYAAGVERALGLFDNILQEWADYIAFLSRLQKALQAQPEGVRVIPDKRTIAKRLAQCLNPSLPSGVHQKTLELYALVFALQGQEGLSHDLALYLPGFSSTLAFASLTVRPIFLSIVEDHILRLPVRNLRPALKAIILSLLPGIEEETSEDFDRVLDILNKIKRLFMVAGSAGIFWQCLFLASITSPGRRLGVLAYLSRYLPKLGKATVKSANGTVDALLDAAVAVTSPEPGLLIRCFATGLLDQQILVQRTFLDLLVTHLPLDATFYKEKVVSEDFKVLVTAAASVVLRRDMSLNRRLWSWFLGPESHGEPTSPEESNEQKGQPLTGVDTLNGSEYFTVHGLDILVASLYSMVARNSPNPSERAQPLRIALSLMDRWEIGGPVVGAVFLPLLRSVQEYKSSAQSQDAFDEILRSASVFFDGVESSLIWSQILQLIDRISKENADEEAFLQNLQLARFIITTFNIREEEMVHVHIPTILLALLCSTTSSGSPAEAALVLSLAQSLALGVADHAFVSDPEADHLGQLSASTVLDRVRTFYASIQSSLHLPQLPFSASQLGELILRHLAASIKSCLPGNERQLESVARILATVLSQLSHSDLYAEILQEVLEHFSLMMTQSQVGRGQPADRNLDFEWEVVSSMTLVVVSICSSQPKTASRENLFALIPPLTKHLWRFLAPASPQHHLEAVRHIWSLQTISSLHRLVESEIISTMLQASEDLGGHHGTLPVIEIDRFGTLWNHSTTLGYMKSAASLTQFSGALSDSMAVGVHPKLLPISFSGELLDGPLLLLLNSLGSSTKSSHEACKDWLQGTLSLARVFQVTVLPLLYTKDPFEANPWLQRLSYVISSMSYQQYKWFSGQEQLMGTLTDSVPGKQSSFQTITAHLAVRLCTLTSKALELLCQLLKAPYGDVLVDEQLESFLILKLEQSVDLGDTRLQTDLIELLLVIQSLKMKQLHSMPNAAKTQHRRLASREKNGGTLNLTVDTESITKAPFVDLRVEPSIRLMPCLHLGLKSSQARPILNKWVALLCEVLPLYSRSIFQILIKLVEILCKEISGTFGTIKLLFSSESRAATEDLEKSLGHLISGLEYILAQAHERLSADEIELVTAKTPDQPQGFLGNIVSGTTVVTEGNQLRNTMANNRLTVVLCLQDSVRVLADLWSWEKTGSINSSDRLASFQYTSSKLRNRSRRILEHLLEVEPLECLETLVEIWVRASRSEPSSSLSRENLVDMTTNSLREHSLQTNGSIRHSASTLPVLDLFQTLDASRPRFTVPAVFNAIYSRTNPTVLNKNQRSTLSSNLSDIELVSFLVQYASSLEDDTLDEIWTDCTTFLRDVLANPMPHRRILPRLLEFIAVIGRKTENTNFGEEWKLRRELGDLFVRLLTAMFTIKPGSQSQDISSADNVIGILCQTLPSMNNMLGESDRLAGVVISISTQIIGPAIRSRNFPQTMTQPLLALMLESSKVSNAAKVWKRDINDAFNDPRFFQTSEAARKPLERYGAHARSSGKGSRTAWPWVPLIAKLYLADRSLAPELLSRLTVPTAAGIMFGVGASAARLDADRKTQLNLRRVAMLILATGNDVVSNESIRAKLDETLTATRVSSPSSLTRAEIFMLVRALALKTSSIQLAALWPAISTELHDVFSSVVGNQPDAYNGFSLLQAAKLLDLLLVIQPDEFQLHEWLFVTDTLDAIYPPDGWQTAALIDKIEDIRRVDSPITPHPSSAMEHPKESLRRPWLCTDATRDIEQDNVLDRLLRPFFGQLSIHAFESTYGLEDVDRAACEDDLMADLFNDDTIVS